MSSWTANCNGIIAEALKFRGGHKSPCEVQFRVTPTSYELTIVDANGAKAELMPSKLLDSQLGHGRNAGRGKLSNLAHAIALGMGLGGPVIIRRFKRTLDRGISARNMGAGRLVVFKENNGTTDVKSLPR